MLVSICSNTSNINIIEDAIKSSGVLSPDKIDEILSFTDASTDVFEKENKQPFDIVQQNSDDFGKGKHYSLDDSGTSTDKNAESLQIVRDVSNINYDSYKWYQDATDLTILRGLLKELVSSYMSHCKSTFEGKTY